MTDIHMHILPGFDDGARDIYESLEMADEAARDGVTDIVATPHCNVPGMSGNYRGSGYEERFSALKNAITQERIPVKLHRGMEVFATEGLTKLIRDEKVLTLAGSRYLLVEFDFGGDPEFADRILDGILSCGLVPVVAHAERYEFVRYDIETVERWRKKGCLIQLNKGSFTGNFGGEVMEAAFFIASQRLADAVASDAHGTDRRTVYMSRAREIVSREISPRYAKYLFDTSPHGIVCDLGAREP